MGEAAPHLSAIKFLNERIELPLLQKIFPSLPTLLANLAVLSFAHSNGDLPDMSDMKSVRSITIVGCCLASESMWLCLPQNLQHLSCEDIKITLPAVAQGGVAVLCCLSAVEVATYSDFALAALVQLLHATPTLSSFGFSHADSAARGESIVCGLTLDDAASLSYLHARMEASPGLVMDVAYQFNGHKDVYRVDDATHQTFCDALPLLTRFTRCTLDNFTPSQLRPLLRAFPNLKQVHLWAPEGLGDYSLQVFTRCSSLTFLEVCYGDDITTVGLFELCMQLRSLRRIKVYHCANLSHVFLNDIMLLLENHQVIVDIHGEDAD